MFVKNMLKVSKVIERVVDLLLNVVVDVYYILFFFFLITMDYKSWNKVC